MKKFFRNLYLKIRTWNPSRWGVNPLYSPSLDVLIKSKIWSENFLHGFSEGWSRANAIEGHWVGVDYGSGKDYTVISVPGLPPFHVEPDELDDLIRNCEKNISMNFGVPPKLLK